MIEKDVKLDTVLIKSDNTGQDNSTSSIKSFQSKNKRSNTKCFVISLILLIIALVSVFRVPYVGSYIDAFIFEYLTGCAKYFVYI